MPGRNSPPMPLRSSTWCSSAFTSVPELWPAAGCTTIPAGLFTTTQVGVLVENRDRDVFRLRAGRQRRRQLDADLVAVLHREVRLGLPARHLDLALVDQPLRLRSRQPGHGTGEIPVQPFARLLGADGERTPIVRSSRRRAFVPSCL